MSALGPQWPITEINVADVVTGKVSHDAPAWPPRSPGARMDDIAAMHASGQIKPVIVRRDHEGEHHLVDGHHRITAAHAAGMKTYPAVVIEGYRGAGELQERMMDVYGTKYEKPKT